VNCGHPECTGVHSGTRPYAEWCPRRRARVRDANERYDSTVKGFMKRVRHNAKKRKGTG